MTECKHRGEMQRNRLLGLYSVESSRMPRSLPLPVHKIITWDIFVQANERRQQLLEAERRKQEAAQRRTLEKAAKKAAEEAAARQLAEEKERKDRAEADRKQARSLDTGCLAAES